MHMMKHWIAAVALAAIAMPAAAATVGQPAPAFSVAASNGNNVSLSDYRGRTVVLEWTNPECPFVQKYAASGALQELQAEARKNDVVWLTVNSAGAGKAGNLSASAANAALRAQGAMPTAYLLDGDGAMARAYGARSTPQLFVIAPDGNIAYAGGFDDLPSADPADIARAKPLLKQALADVAAGRAVATPNGRAYGCSIK